MRTAYWITTAILCLGLLPGFLDITHNRQMVIGVKELGYPEYFLTTDGAAKLLAILGLLIPKVSTVREWTYAGLTFLAIGAAWSHLANNQSPLAPSVFMALTLTSYGLWLKTPDLAGGKRAIQA